MIEHRVGHVPFMRGSPLYRWPAERLRMRSVISVAALPMSIWLQAMSYLRPSSEMRFGQAGDGVLGRRVGAELGRGAWAEIEPLLMMRPPRGSCAFIMRIASCAHRNAPVRLASTTAFHCS